VLTLVQYKAQLDAAGEPQGSLLPTGPRRKWRGFCLGGACRDKFASPRIETRLAGFRS